MNQPRRPQLAEQPQQTEGIAAPSRPTPQWGRRQISMAAAVLCWLYLLGVLASWLFVRIEGDRWWPATMLLFGPRWTWLLPLLVLVPLCIAVRRRWLLGLLIVALIIAIPIMDLRVTRPGLSSLGLSPMDRQQSALRVLTINTHFTALDAVAFKAVIDQTKPDVVALQEWYPGNRATLFPDSSWHIIQSPEAFLASRYPIQLDGPTISERDITAGVTYHYKLMLPAGAVSLYSAHLSSPHTVFRGVLHLSRYGPRRLDLNSRQRLKEATRLQQAADNDTLVVGDLNLPRDSTIYRSTLAAYSDAFTVAGLGYGLTYYSRYTALRIDHILFGQNWRCTRCWVGPDVGSPHRPVIADLAHAPN